MPSIFGAKKATPLIDKSTPRSDKSIFPNFETAAMSLAMGQLDSAAKLYEGTKREINEIWEDQKAKLAKKGERAAKKGVRLEADYRAAKEAGKQFSAQLNAAKSGAAKRSSQVEDAFASAARPVSDEDAAAAELARRELQRQYTYERISQPAEPLSRSAAVRSAAQAKAAREYAMWLNSPEARAARALFPIEGNASRGVAGRSHGFSATGQGGPASITQRLISFGSKPSKVAPPPPSTSYWSADSDSE